MKLQFNETEFLNNGLKAVCNDMTNGYNKNNQAELLTKLLAKFPEVTYKENFSDSDAIVLFIGDIQVMIDYITGYIYIK